MKNYIISPKSGSLKIKRIIVDITDFSMNFSVVDATTSETIKVTAVNSLSDLESALFTYREGKQAYPEYFI